MADRSGEMKNEPSSSPSPPVVLLLELRGSLGEGDGECVIEAREPLLRSQALTLTFWGSDIVSTVGMSESSKSVTQAVTALSRAVPTPPP